MQFTPFRALDMQLGTKPAQFAPLIQEREKERREREKEGGGGVEIERKEETVCDHTPGPVGPMVCRGASQAPPRGARAADSEGYEVYY